MNDLRRPIRLGSLQWPIRALLLPAFLMVTALILPQRLFAAPLVGNETGAAAVLNAPLLFVRSDQAVAVDAPPAGADDENMLFLPLIGWGGRLNTSHFGRYTTYEGSKTCQSCHLDETKEMHASVHYQWRGPTPHVQNMDEGGKLGGINDFCGYPDINFIGQMTNLDNETVDGGCATCHTGLGAKPAAEASEAQLENIDCLVCHSDAYQRKVERTDVGFAFVPAPEKMTVELLEAITDVHLPTDESCVGCHAFAGGGHNNKRGDIELAHLDPPSKSFDVHMASAGKGGAGLRCLDCHITQEHRIAGRGSDLRPTDLDLPVRCTNCHADQPHDEGEIDKHTARVDCTSCHIPAFARIQSTDMLRDFRSAEIDEAKRLYEPTITREANVIPEYRFFNGTSLFYEYDTPVNVGEDGRVVMSQPLGDINDSNAKIFPFKHHVAVQAYDNSTGKLIPAKMGVLFQTGDTDAAIRQGAAAVGWPLADGYNFVQTERFMGIFHEVAPEDDALECNDCHGGTRLDFDALGYTPRTEREGKPLCSSCHEDESDEWDADEFFMKVHEKHVGESGDDDVTASAMNDESFDCIECHTFSAAR